MLASFAERGGAQRGVRSDGRCGDPTTFVVETTEPDARVVLAVDEIVHAGSADDVPPDAVVLRGRGRRPRRDAEHPVPFDTIGVRPSVPDSKRWLISGLANIFEVA